MTFYDIINQRESIRNYDPQRPVDKEILLRILNAGRLAPSAANRQPWKFYLVSEIRNLDKIRKCYHREWFWQAPHVLVVAGALDNAWTRGNDGYNTIETDLTIAMDHMILAAETEGVATCWIAAFDYPKLKSTGLFGEGEVVFAITPLGYPKTGFSKRGIKDRKKLDEVAIFL